MREILRILVLLLLVSLLTRRDVGAEPDRAATKVGYMPIVDHLILGLAKEKAVFSKQSLHPVRFTDWATMTEALRAGSIQGAFVLAPLAFQLKRSGAPVQLVLLGHRDGSALIVKVKAGIDNVQDLKGKTIAIPQRFSTHNMLLHLYTTAAGLRYEKDFKVVELNPTEMVAALSGGDIDGYIVAEPIAARGELLGFGKVLVFSGQIWKHHPDCVLVLREEFINGYPAAFHELVTNLITGGDFIESHREEAAEIGAKFLVQPLDAMKRALLEPQDRVTFQNLTPDLAELSRIYNYLKDTMKLFPDSIEMESFVNTSAAREAYEQRQR